MNISKLEPIKIEGDDLAVVNKAVNSQQVSSGTPRVSDPNFPIFVYETNNKHLIYVPNFYTEDEHGAKELLREVAYVHGIRTGNRFSQVRATQGMQGLGHLGISGDSPLNAANQECWELYNLKYKAHANSLGIDPDNDTGDVLKGKRTELLKEMVVSGADRRHYFPIVVFETEKDPKTGKNTNKIVMDKETKKPKFQIMWMDVSDAQWDKKWKKALDTLADGDCHAGQFIVLNYELDGDNTNNPNARRDSGRDMTIAIMNKTEAQQKLAPWLDEQAKEWTPAKAREVIYACALYSDEQQELLVEDLMQPVRAEIATIQKMQLGGDATQIQAPATADDALANFGGVDSQSTGGEENSQTTPEQGLEFGASK